ncbi:1060_t:CDS:2, partial [Acaulospora colombiana]
MSTKGSSHRTFSSSPEHEDTCSDTSSAPSPFTRVPQSDSSDEASGPNLHPHLPSDDPKLTSEAPVSSLYLDLKFSTVGELYSRLTYFPLHELRSWFTSYSWTPEGPRNAKSSYLTPLTNLFIHHLRDLECMDIRDLVLRLRHSSVPLASNLDGLIYQNLQLAFPPTLLSRLLYVSRLNELHNQRAQRQEDRNLSCNELIAERQHIINDWPQLIPQDTILQCCSDYAAATNIK